MKELKTLDASYCASLARIPSSIGDLVSLSCLDLTECHKLVQLPDSIGSLMSLLYLLLSRCHSLRQIPDSIGKLTSLTELHLKSTAIMELPESIGNMQNLRMLDISGTPIIELLDDKRFLAELQGLRASGWKNLEGLPSHIGQLVSAVNLDLDELQKLSKLRSRVLALGMTCQILQLPNLSRLTFLKKLTLSNWLECLLDLSKTPYGKVVKLDFVFYFWCIFH